MELNENRESFKKKSKQGNLKSTLITGGIGLAIGVILAGGIPATLTKKSAPTALLDVELETIVEEGDITISASELEKVIESASELVSEKYHYQELYEEKKEGTKVAGVTVPGTEELTLVLYDGTISAGIEVSEISFNIDDEKRILKITMPKAKILSHEVDHSSVKSYEVKTALFSKKTYEDFAGVIALAQKEKENSLKTDGEFFQKVQDDAQNTISTLLTASGVTKGYTIIFS